MPRKFKPGVLFEPFRRSKHALKNPPYRGWQGEIDGVESGRKPIARYSIGIPDDTTKDFVGPMLRRGLTVALRGAHGNLPLERQPISAYVCRPDQLWRVPALLAIHTAAIVGWPDGLEAYESTLLGYTRAQRERWLEHLEQGHEYYLYTLLSADQVTRVRALGQRCFGTCDQVTGMTFFMYVDGVLKPSARTLVPSGLTLARTKGNAGMFRALFDETKKRRLEERWRRLSTFCLSRKQATALTVHMDERIQLLTRSGWQ